MEDELRSNRLMVEFFTYSYRISGNVYVHVKKLADQLDDPTTSFLELEDAYVSNIEHPADIVAHHTTSILRKSKIIAAVTARAEDGIPRQRSYGSYLGPHVSRVFLLAPSFEIQGNLRLSSKMDLRRVLATGTDSFVILLDGQMGSAARPDNDFTGGAILVNKSYIEAFWIVRGEESNG